MSPTMNEDHQGPKSGHLGVEWEIAIVAVFVSLFIAIAAVFVVQYRRKQRRRNQGRSEAALEKAEEPNQTNMTDPVDVPDLSRPSPAALRESKTSLHSDHAAHRPRRYYWDTR
ncbi:hypothetical protein BD779DRAFT_1535753 [Infundibulicybe gibba]|nr:hypothetical protein BD779DRAFT_1535753 [Infundibulicybe gibba]